MKTWHAARNAAYLILGAGIAVVGALVPSARVNAQGDMPPQVQFVDFNVWQIGEPDLIVRSPLQTVKAIGSDVHLPYLGSAPTGLTEDRWIMAFQVRELRQESQTSPGRTDGGNNVFVLHH